MTRQLKPCGTDAAYRRHLRNGEPIDAKCRAAVRSDANTRAREDRERVAKAVKLAIAAEPPVTEVDELADALENLRIVRGAMKDAPASALPALSKRREELTSRVLRLKAAADPKVSVLDEIRRRRDERFGAPDHIRGGA